MNRAFPVLLLLMLAAVAFTYVRVTEATGGEFIYLGAKTVTVYATDSLYLPELREALREGE